MSVISSLKPGEQVSADDPGLFNMNDLAVILRVNRGYIRTMKRCGFKMPGNRATIAMAHEFLRNNPDLTVPDKKEE